MDRGTPDRYIALSAKDAASVLIEEELNFLLCDGRWLPNKTHLAERR